VILLVVLTFHVALLAALLRAPRFESRVASTEHSVELLVLPPVKPPSVRAEWPAVILGGGLTLKMVPPALQSEAPSLSPLSASSSDGTGSGVDWAAEARRALQAAEIRNHEPPRNDSLSSAPKEDDWWPRAPHHAGEEFKTPSGDWIVWINATCYRVAGSTPSVNAPGAPPSRAICPGASSAAAN
jgi:hypothetical protein